MSRLPAAVFTAAILALFTTGPGSAAQPTPVPDRKPDLSAMAFLIGTWTCHQKLRGADRPDTITYAMALDGRWITDHDEAPPFDKFRTKTIVSDDRMTYNPLTKQWAFFGSDSFGGYIVSTSPGWVGSTMVWTSSLISDGSTGKLTNTKVSDTETRYVVESREKNGKADPSEKGICKKSV
jgi:hypothetical protein